MVVPTMLDRILDVLGRTGEKLPALRALSYGGGRMPEPVIARALQALPHVDFVNAYGLTETSSTVALLGADDALDVFGVHGVGGIVGAILTGVFAAPGLGGTGAEDFSIASQVWIQTWSVIVTVVWSAVVAFVAYKVADLLVGLRAPEEEEREGLDTVSHGERAYS